MAFNLATKSPEVLAGEPLQQVFEAPQDSAGGLATAGTPSGAVASLQDNQHVPPSPSSFLRGLQPLLQSYAAAEHSLSGASSATASGATASSGKGMTAEEAEGLKLAQITSPLAVHEASAAAGTRAAEHASMKLATKKEAVKDKNTADMPISSIQKKPRTRQSSKHSHSQALAVKNGGVAKQVTGKKGSQRRGQRQQIPQAQEQVSSPLDEEPSSAKKPDRTPKPSTKRAGKKQKGRGRPKGRVLRSPAEKGEDLDAAKSKSRRAHQKPSTQNSLPSPIEEAAETAEILEPKILADTTELPLRQTRSQHPVLPTAKQLPQLEKKAKARKSKPAARKAGPRAEDHAQSCQQTQFYGQKSQENASGNKKPSLTLQLEGGAEQAIAPMSSPFEEASLVGFPSQGLDENAPPLWIAASGRLPSETSSEEGSPTDDSDADAAGPHPPVAEVTLLERQALGCIQGKTNANEEAGGTSISSAVDRKASTKGREAGKLPCLYFCSSFRLVLSRGAKMLPFTQCQASARCTIWASDFCNVVFRLRQYFP